MTISEELKSLYESQIQTCKDAINRSIKLRELGKISDSEYYSRIDLWDSKQHESSIKLLGLKK